MKKVASPDANGRGKGRPQKDSNPKARDALIDAAKELLRTQPPSQINRLELAKNAGVDPALVRYYFGNKDLLLVETAQKIMRDVRAKRRTANKSQESFRGKLTTSTRSTIDLLWKYPHLHELLLEQISSAHESKAADLRDVFIEDPFAEMKEMLENAAEQGEIRPVEAAYFYVALIGMCSFAMGHRALLSELLGSPDLDEGTSASYAEFVVDLMISGVGVKQGAPKAVGADTKSVQTGAAAPGKAIGKRSSSGRRSGSTSTSKEPVSRPKPT